MWWAPCATRYTLCLACMLNRYRLRFFDQVGHQTTYASIENKHFITKSCHRQTYQSYEQHPQSLQNLFFQSLFLASKISQIFLNCFFCKEYLTSWSTFINEIFWKLWFLKYFVFLKCAQFLSGSVHNFGRSDDDVI